MVRNKKKSFFFFLLFMQNFLFAESLSIVSWNIQHLGRTKDASEINVIAKIVKNFDIVVIQEVVAIDPAGAQKVAELADNLNRMGAKWDFRVSDPTDSPGNRKERYAYLWKTSKVKLLGRPWLDKTCEPIMYREPYLARFQANGKPILVVNYHARSYKDTPQREIPCLYDLQNTFPDDCILIAGDWNAYTTDKVFEPLWDQGFVANIKSQKTTLRRECSSSGEYFSRPIDFILYEKNEFIVESTGVIDLVQDCNFLAKVRRLSDHLPVFIEIDF